MFPPLLNSKEEKKMKNIKLLYILISFLFLTQANFATNWDDPDHGFFKLQTDIDQEVSSSSVAMATTYRCLPRQSRTS